MLPKRPPRRVARTAAIVGGTVSVLALASTPATAHAGALSGSRGQVSVPLWLFLTTGGGVVAGSFLLVSFLTDVSFIRAIHARRRRLPSVRGFLRAGSAAGTLLGIVALVTVLVSGFLGPTEPTANLGILLVWAGWWAGYTISVYVLGNTWPAINPFATIVSWLPAGIRRSYPDRFGRWPAVIGVLLIVYVEVVTPLAEAPRLLATAVLGYGIVTVGGALLYGRAVWFERVDPVANVFRYYGAMAPIQWTDDGIEFRLPGSCLVDADLVEGTDEVAFVIALLWGTTFDGFVSTVAWGPIARGLVGVGLPPSIVYLGAMIAGFGLFFGLYLAGSRAARRTAGSYVAPQVIAERFAPAMVPIAAGYHLAHYVGYFLSFLPALVEAVLDPLGPAGRQTVLLIPSWFGGVQFAAVLLGHLFAVWVAHGIAFEVFTGRLQPIRSQYPFTVLMIAYTMTSLWIVTQPYAPLPYV